MIKKKSFIVSCQAMKGEPLYGKGIPLKLANAAFQGGAEGLRISQIENIKDVIAANFNLPIIGLIKKKYSNSEIHITPTLKELKALVTLKVDVIAIDATNRKRPKENLDFLIKWFKSNKLKNQKILADCSNEEDIKEAINYQFDYIATTLRGYTKETTNQTNIENNFAFVKWAIKICAKNNIPLIVEGGINTPKFAKKILDLGAYAVVVGSAITRPKFITELFFKEISK